MKKRFSPKAGPSLITILIIVGCLASETKFVKIILPDGFKITAELALTEEKRQQGLMHRQGMKEDEGMLFVFEREDYYAFWMKNMHFSLDLFWLDRERRIVHIEKNVPPCLTEPCPSYEPEAPALYVLELVAGSAQKHGLKLGDRLEFILPSIKPKEKPSSSNSTILID